MQGTDPDRESVLQFGGGNFMRAFADLFLHETNSSGGDHGRAVVVTSTVSDRSRWINQQSGRYHVVVRGLRERQRIDETIHVCRALSRALSAESQWPQVLQFATSEDLRWILSNTTEAGLQLSDDDRDPHEPPVSFPAKLLAVLSHRHQAGLQGLTILPCELVDNNAERLHSLVLEQARRWRCSDVLLAWISEQCHWVNTLVDRIVSGQPEEHPLLEQDALLTVTEPFALWAVEDRGNLDLFDHAAILRTADVTPYSLRKVRILNGAHTALVAKAMPLGIETVGDAIVDPDVQAWLRRLLEEEILPALGDRVEDASGFAEATLERFANPSMQHRLRDIALHHETKVETRLRPTLDDFVDRFGRQPPLLSGILDDRVR